MTRHGAGFYLFGMMLHMGLAAALLSAMVAGAADVNHCVSCHRAANLPISLGHTFDDWHGSAHGRGGVGCEKCHGGDPDTADADRAHEGTLPAADPKSMVNAARLPETCGNCHRPELQAFNSTVHAKILDAAGRGPTCSTCHGAMASSLPSPGELDARCETCHKKPVEAKTALAVLANTKTQLYRTRQMLAGMKSTNPKWHAGALERFHEIERAYADIQMRWHTFAAARVLQECRDLQKLTKALDDEAAIMARRGAE